MLYTIYACTSAHVHTHTHTLVSTSKLHGLFFWIVLWDESSKIKQGKRVRGRKREGWFVKKAFSEQENRTPA